MCVEIAVSVIISLNDDRSDIYPFLRSLAESVLPSNIEVILIGGASPENVQEIIRPDSEGHAGFSVISGTCQGESVIRNRGLAAAKGEYVTFVKGGDRVELDKLSAVYNQAKRIDADMILTQVMPSRSEGEPIRCGWPIPDSMRNVGLPGRDAFITLMRSNSYSASINGGLYKREWLERNGLSFDERSICPDELWTPWAFCTADRIVLSDTGFYHRLTSHELFIQDVDHEGGMWAEEFFYAGDRMSEFAGSFTTFDKDKELKSWLLTNALRVYTSACRIITAIRTHGTFELPTHRMHIFKTIESEMIPEVTELCHRYYRMATAWEQEYLLWKDNPCDPVISATPEKELNSKRIILVYNSPGWQDYCDTLSCLPAGYVLTLDRKYLDQAFAVVFHLPGLYEHLYGDLEKRDGQIWVRWNMEPDCNFNWMQQLDQLNVFDFRMDYHPDADIVCPYYARFKPVRMTRRIDTDLQKSRICMLISSSVHQSGREEYLAELMEHAVIDSYGRLYKNCSMEEDKGWESKIALYSGYKFVIAFENSIQADYVTEKLYDPLLAGAVPIYFGAPNVDDYLPGDNCIIRADRFESPKALAQYIERCYTDRKEYMKYHQWRSLPWKTTFLNKVAIQDDSPFVRLCRLLDSRYPHRETTLR